MDVCACDRRPEVLSAFQRSEVLAYFVKIEERDMEETRPQLTNALHVVKLLFVDFLIRRKEYKVKTYIYVISYLPPRRLQAGRRCSLTDLACSFCPLPMTLVMSTSHSLCNT